MFKFHDITKCLYIKKKHNLLNNFWVKDSLLMKFGQFISYKKGEKISKNSTKTVTWKLVPHFFCVCKELSTISIGKWIFFKWGTYIRYVITKLSKFIQISMQASWDSVLQPRTSFQVTFFVEFLDKNFSFVILHKLVKFH